MAYSTPRFSVVSAAYDVGRYLPDFIASIEEQTHDLSEVEVVMVDDGSNDDTGAVLDAWARRRPELVRVVHQDNAGQAAARNAGLRDAGGDWVTFPDPDDVLAPDYLASVAAFIEEHPDADLVAANRLLWHEESGAAGDTHPLRHLFTRDHLVDLGTTPGYFQGSAPAAFFRLDRIRQLELEFDPRVRPTYEDGHFTGRYLLATDRPRAGFLASAQYHYRRRADGSSTMQLGQGDLDRYLTVTRFGYLDILRTAHAQRGHIPLWLQHQLVFDLSYYFNQTDPEAESPRPVEGADAETFHELIASILGQLDLDTVVPTTPSPLRRTSRYVLQHGYRDQPWHEPYAVVSNLDRQQRLVRVSYFYTGSAPEEELRCNDEVVAPKHAKSRSYAFYGRILLRERLLWVPSRQNIELSLDGEQMPLVFRRPPFPRLRITPAQVGWHLGRDEAAALPLSDQSSGLTADAASGPLPTSKLGIRAQRDMHKPRVRERYRNAWVLTDRSHAAGDRAETLFRHLRAHHTEINAWFAIEKNSRDAKRLVSEGYADRLLDHGSLEWRLAMANCLHLVSSQTDEAVVAPPSVLEFTRARWRFTFLSHQATGSDHVARLNRIPINTFVTSTPQEYAAVAGDDTPYPFTTKETVIAGIPHRDRESCERVVAAIRRSVRPQGGAEPVPTPAPAPAPAPTPTAGGQAR